MRLFSHKLNHGSFSIRIFSVFSVFLFIMVSSFISYFIFNKITTANSTLINKGTILAEVLAHNSRIGVFSENKTLLANAIASVFEQKEALEVSIFNHEGVLLAKQERSSDQPSGTETPSDNDATEIMKKREFPYYRQVNRRLEFWQPVISSSSANIAESFLFSDDPSMNKKDQIIGLIRITLDKKPLNTQIRQVLVRSITLGVSFLVIGACLIFFLAKGITKPLNSLTESVKALESGEKVETVPIKTSDEIGRLALAFNNMSESLQKRERSLRESEEKYRSILQNIEEGYYECDISGTYVFANDSFSRILGYSKEEILGTNYQRYMMPGYADAGWRAIKKVVEDERPLKEIEVELIKKDGDRIFVESSASAIIGSDERPIGFRGIVRDITDRKLAEEEKRKLYDQLQQSQKMEAIGTLAGGIAHDFNNILAAIIGFSELALSRSEADPGIKRDLQEVLIAGQRAKELVRQILTFSRQTQKERIPVQMSLITKEALKFLRSSLPATIEIRQNVISKSRVLSDPTQLHQIVMNLCANAAHAMRGKGGILELTLTDVTLDPEFISTHPEIQPGAYLKLTISDTGHGMPPEIMDRVFDPFFTTKPKDEGTGLGLSVVHGIVRDCDGTITVYSEPDKGTTFDVYFPIVEAMAQEKSRKYTAMPTGTEKILVVDDEKAILDLTRKNLTSLGYAVEVRTSSLEALEFFKAMPNKFDLVITDMTMPKMTGDKLAWELMKIRPDIPVILCTGFSGEISKERAEAIGIKAFLMKPLLRKEMAHMIRKVLDEVKKPSHCLYSYS